MVDTKYSRVTELDQYGDYTPYGIPLGGTVPSLFQAPSVTWGPVSQAMLPMFWTGSQFTKKNTRDGVMAVLEYKPNKDLRSQLDLSCLNTQQRALHVPELTLGSCRRPGYNSPASAGARAAAGGRTPKHSEQNAC